MKIFLNLYRCTTSRTYDCLRTQTSNFPKHYNNKSSSKDSISSWIFPTHTHTRRVCMARSLVVFPSFCAVSHYYFLVRGEVFVCTHVSWIAYKCRTKEIFLLCENFPKAKYIQYIQFERKSTEKKLKYYTFQWLVKEIPRKKIKMQQLWKRISLEKFKENKITCAV